jgi:hypothetical protein
MNWFVRFALWLTRYQTTTLNVGRDFGFGESMTVIRKKRKD